MPPALHNLQPGVAHLGLQRPLGQPTDVLRLREDGLVPVAELQIPRLKNGLQGVRGAAVVVPFQRREEEVQDVGEESGDVRLHLRGGVQD